MFELFIDESGKPTNYRDSNGNIILENQRYFTLGGISVDKNAKQEFHEVYNKIMFKYSVREKFPPNQLKQFVILFSKILKEKKF